MSDRFGLLCFTKHWRNPVLWSHYADTHRGLCLGFEVDDTVSVRVRYTAKRKTIKWPFQMSEDFAREVLMTKF